MSHTVHEALPVAGLVDDRPSGGIDLDAGDTGPYHIDRGLLRLAHDVMDLLQLDRRLPERDRAGHVGVVAVDERPHVELDHVALLQDAMARLVMGLGSVLAEGHDRIESEPIRTRLEHQALELPSDPSLRDTESEPVQQPGERRIRRRLRTPDQLPLLVVLHATCVLDHVLRRDQLHVAPQRPGQPGMLRHGHAASLDPEPRHRGRRAPFRDRAAVGALGRDALDVRQLAARLFRVPSVRQEELDRTSDEELSVRTGEPRQVPRVGEVGHEERVHPEVVETRGDRASPQLVIHGIASSAR